MADRSFTFDEAQTLLPVLESLLRTAIEGKKLIEIVDAELQELAHRVFLSGGLLVNIIQVARRKAEREKTIRSHFCSMTKVLGNSQGLRLGSMDIRLKALLP